MEGSETSFFPPNFKMNECLIAKKKKKARKTQESTKKKVEIIEQ